MASSNLQCVLVQSKSSRNYLSLLLDRSELKVYEFDMFEVI